MDSHGRTPDAVHRRTADIFEIAIRLDGQQLRDLKTFGTSSGALAWAEERRIEALRTAR
jgi:hypothetical protein